MKSLNFIYSFDFFSDTCAILVSPPSHSATRLWCRVTVCSVSLFTSRSVFFFVVVFLLML